MARVEVAIYDLSMGMASTLSGQLLGQDHAIPMIPHTAVLVYGREYFFSQGIQNVGASEFQRSTGMRPVQVLNVGTTNVTKEEFDRWCYSGEAQALYNETSYDLFTRNCNNFTDYAIKNGLLLHVGVPQWILDVPNKVRNSPMGQMLMPMMQSMQAPFTPSGSNTMNTSYNSSSVLPPTQNPWANLSSGSGDNTSGINTTTSSYATPAQNPWAQIPSNKKEATAEAKIDTPFLDSNSKFLLSNESSTIPLCIKKLKAQKDNFSSENGEKLCPLDTLQQQLNDKSLSVTPSVVEQTLWQYVKRPAQKKEGDSNASPTPMLMALMLLRLVVIRSIPSTSDVGILRRCIDSIVSHLVTSDDNLISKNKSVRCMAWCTLSNALSNHSMLFSGSLSVDKIAVSGIFSGTMEQLLDCAIQDLESAKKEIAQSASAFLYNLVHALTINRECNNEPDLPDWVVSVLCSCLDSLQNCDDEVTLFRRLLTAGRILRTFGIPAVAFVSDLGFGSILETEVAKKVLGNNLRLVNEIVNVIIGCH